MAVALAPVQTGGGAEDPFAMFSGWDSGQLLWLAVLVPLAVLVFFVGSRRQRQQLGSSSLVPRGRDRLIPRFGAGRRDARWRATVERLERRDPTAIAKAQAGPVRIEAVIQSASGNLGGAAGYECVWRNRAGAGPQTAVAADLLVVSDGTGLCGVEELEGARVIAPTDKVGAHYQSVSLRIGDRIEVVGCFEPDLTGRHEDPTQLVYGTVGTDGRLEIRVLDRPEPEPPAEPDDPAEASSEPDATS